MFPSPFGELSSLTKERELAKLPYFPVSVPFRGTIFLNDVKEQVQMNMDCFRPLSGNYLP